MLFRNGAEKKDIGFIDQTHPSELLKNTVLCSIACTKTLKGSFSLTFTLARFILFFYFFFWDVLNLCDYFLCNFTNDASTTYTFLL